MLHRIRTLFKAATNLVSLCLKGTAMLLLCGILAITLFNLVDSIPLSSVSSIQVEKKLPPLAASPKYDFKRSIVRLYAGDDFVCSGVVVGSNYVLTASHCLVDEDYVMKKQEITVVNDDGSVRVKARPVGVNTRMDWGLIKGDFSRIPGSMVVEIGFHPEPGVVMCGYPQGSHAINCQVAEPITNDAFLIKCRPGGMLFPGMSGGPVFNGNGEVIGLNVLVYPAAEGGGVAYTPVTGILASFHITDF